jgi:predicted ribonuclease YlaK
MQVCNQMEILTVGTRIGEGSKLVVLGDLNQRDENISREKTGLYKLMNDKKWTQYLFFCRKKRPYLVPLSSIDTP